MWSSLTVTFWTTLVQQYQSSKVTQGLKFLLLAQLVYYYCTKEQIKWYNTKGANQAHIVG